MHNTHTNDYIVEQTAGRLCIWIFSRIVHKVVTIRWTVGDPELGLNTLVCV